MDQMTEADWEDTITRAMVERVPWEDVDDIVNLVQIEDVGDRQCGARVNARLPSEFESPRVTGQR